MLMPLPATLRRLLTEYEALLAAAGTSPPGQHLRNVEYTLCVSTGTREITHALHKAHSYLAACSDTPATAGGKRSPERAVAEASPAAPALTATVFQHEISALQRGIGEHPRLGHAALPGSHTARPVGQWGDRT
ncbi:MULTISPECIES: DUF5133 domain-containing protein [unclassified Streptomyces]|uniref:DUF5133 domain-containing protein n=1 Tax=unclassified Streptomyces TaxID=2593676 RepID=UPI00344F8620